MQKLLTLSLIIVSLLTTGCTGLLVGGAVAGGTAAASTAHDRRTAGRVVDDRTLQIRVSRNISKDDFLSSYSHVNVTVYDAVVLLTGETSTRDIKERIINIARNTEGVKRVEADLIIDAKSSLWSRTNDTAITGKVKAALLSLDIPNFDPTLVKVVTERGNVYLMGFATESESNQIAEKVRRVSGVKSVIKVFEYK